MIKKLFSAVALLVGITAAQAQTKITELHVTLPIEEINFYIGNTEGNVDKLIGAKVKLTDKSCDLNISNTGLRYKNVDQYYGIGDGNNSVSAEKEYAVVYAFEPKSGYEFPAGLGTVKFYLNDKEQILLETDVRGSVGDECYFFTVALPAPTAAPKPSHTLTVTNALEVSYDKPFTGGSYLKGAVASFRCATISGKKFDHWEATGITLTEEQRTATTLTITMPDADVTVNAIFTTNNYSLNCKNTAEESKTAVYDREITLNPATISGKKFDHWEATGITLTEEQRTAVPLTFKMPAKNVKVEAVFIDATAADDAQADAFTAVAVGRTLSVNGAADIVRVYNASGALVATIPATESASIQLPASGVYAAVSVGKTIKVIAQ